MRPIGAASRGGGREGACVGMGVGVGVGMGAHPCEGVGEVAGVSPRSNMTGAVTRR